MKWFKRISLGLVGLIVLIVVGGYLFLRYGMPKKIDPPQIAVPRNDTALIARGKYLANHVSPCFVCHSPRDHHKFGAPVLLDSLGAGKVGFGHREHFPGEMYFYNITPYRLASWSDGEIYRVINAGITKDGEPVFPFMPYHFIGRMDSTDIVSIIAYLRTLKPIPKESGKSEFDFPVNLIMRTLPEKQKQYSLASLTTPELKGEYLTTIGACKVCHTPTNDKDQILEEHIFEGGRKFYGPDGSMIISANLTPDPETGIGDWSEQAFINRFRSYINLRHAPNLEPGDKQTTMPWAEFAGMKDEDLKAIYAYLRSLKPVKNPNESQYYFPPDEAAKLQQAGM